MGDEEMSLAGRSVFVCAADGPSLASEADALDLMGALWGRDIDWLAFPVARLSADFLSLRTGVAGAVIQKFVNYRLRLALVGDISAETAASDALNAFVRESDAGDHVWFVPDLETFERRLFGAAS